MIVVNATQPTWPLNYVVYTATLPSALTGADVTIFAAAFTYLIDITSSSSRTTRVTLLEVCYLATMPIGIALGAVLFKSVGGSYAIMFSINIALMVAAILYSWLRLKWRTNDRQKPLPSARYLLGDFFNINHVMDTFRTLFRKRPNNGRVILLTLIVMMALYTFQRDEKAMSYLYVQLIFKWGVDQFSHFRTFQSALQDVLLLLAIPLMSKVFGLRDTVIIMVGAAAHSIGRIFYAEAQVTWVFYIGTIRTNPLSVSTK